MGNCADTLKQEVKKEKAVPQRKVSGQKENKSYKRKYSRGVPSYPSI